MGPPVLLPIYFHLEVIYFIIKRRAWVVSNSLFPADSTSCLRYAQPSTKVIHLNNLHICSQSSHQEDSTYNSGRQAQIYLQFSESRQTLELKLSQLPRRLCEIHFLTTLWTQAPHEMGKTRYTSYLNNYSLYHGQICRVVCLYKKGYRQFA